MKNIIAFGLLLLLTSFSKVSETHFYIVAKPGLIVDKYTNIVYICGDRTSPQDERSVYDVSIKSGTYAYINFDKSDTITFAIDKTGAYKIGFQENHSSFTILKKSPFDESR